MPHTQHRVSPNVGPTPGTRGHGSQDTASESHQRWRRLSVQQSNPAVRAFREPADRLQRLSHRVSFDPPVAGKAMLDELAHASFSRTEGLPITWRIFFPAPCGHAASPRIIIRGGEAALQCPACRTVYLRVMLDTKQLAPTSASLMGTLRNEIRWVSYRYGSGVLSFHGADPDEVLLDLPVSQNLMGSESW